MGDSTLLPRILSVKPVWPWPVLLCAPRERAIDARAMTLRANRGCEARRSRPQSRPRGGARCEFLRCERCARCRIFPALAAPLSPPRRSQPRASRRWSSTTSVSTTAPPARSRWWRGRPLARCRLPCRRHAVHPCQRRRRNPRKRPQNRWSAPPAASPRRSSRSRRRSSITAPRMTPPRSCQNCPARCASTRRRRACSATPRRACALQPVCDAAMARDRAALLRPPQRPSLASVASHCNCDGGLLPDWPERADLSRRRRCRCRRRSGEGRAAAALGGAEASPPTAPLRRGGRAAAARWHAPTRRSSSCSRVWPLRRPRRRRRRRRRARR